MKEALEFYKDILTDIGLDVQEDGLVTMSLGGEDVPAKCDGDRVMVLPTREQLRLEKDWSTRMAFHPLSESITRGESTVFKVLKAYANMSITSKANTILKALGTMLQDPNVVETLKPKQAKLLKNLTKYKKTSQTVLNKVMSLANPNDVDNRLINIYIKKAGKVGGSTFAKASIVTFPLLEGLVEDELDIKYQNKTDKDQVIKLFEVLFPNWDGDTYNCGTNSPIAPNLVSFLMAFKNITTQINSVVDNFSKIIPELADLKYHQAWADKEKDELTKMANSIPPLEGNTGSFKRVEEAKETVVQEQGETTNKSVSQEDSGWAEILTPPRLGLGMQQPAFGNTPRTTGNGWDSLLGANQQNQVTTNAGMGSRIPLRNMSRVQQIRMQNEQSQPTFNAPIELPPWADQTQLVGVTNQFQVQKLNW